MSRQGNDLSAFAAQCTAFAATMPVVQRQATRKAASTLVSVLRARTAAAAPSGVLSGVGRAGARVGIRSKPLRNGAGAVVFAFGPYHLIERDTSSHFEPRIRRRGKQRPLRLPGVGYRMSVHHPGTRGRHPFERGVSAYGPKIPGVYQREVAAAMARTFR